MVTSHLHILYLCFAHSLSLHFHCSARHPACQHSDFLVVPEHTVYITHAGTTGNTQLTLATITTNWNKPPLRHSEENSISLQ